MPSHPGGKIQKNSRAFNHLKDFDKRIFDNPLIGLILSKFRRRGCSFFFKEKRENVSQTNSPSISPPRLPTLLKRFPERESQLPACAVESVGNLIRPFPPSFFSRLCVLFLFCLREQKTKDVIQFEMTDDYKTY